MKDIMKNDHTFTVEIIIVELSIWNIQIKIINFMTKTILKKFHHAKAPFILSPKHFFFLHRHYFETFSILHSTLDLLKIITTLDIFRRSPLKK